MRDFQRCQSAATGSACPEKGPALQLTPRHLELIRAAQQALHRATDQTASSAERIAALPAWSTAAERLAVALIASLESIEEAHPWP
ncbi:hypothetical protein SAMN04244572_04547 [Azotobacter beijerinckii]|uniref:Uncharacterized protein n=1 Tax=Azotobacter beijerinckii TaxID=170623 RepID=A0A1H6Z465_9GAMM|nr:hypothetical protein [Azotobacter beijerinckii]SEJ43735.1 hypothetical protein SAMN04244579_04357 [Azotobacter beijerinckii]SEJ57789.1 hypothetical protein SAMN04244572_04547 [Azotobacter beijerinckii]